MALQQRGQTESLEDPVEENETGQVAHRSNSSEVAAYVEKIKKGIDETIKAMENAHNATYEMKLTTDEIKIKLSKKKSEMEKLQGKLEDTKKQAELDNQKGIRIKNRN